MNNRNKHLAPEAVKAKILRYCAYQERCHQEVRQKLYELGLFGEKLNEMIAFLITEGFLNEERYTKAFAGGKFRMKGWGRIKIIQALESKGITSNCIKAGLKEIDEADYTVALRKLLEKRLTLLSDESDFIKRNVIAKFAIQKGFEPELVWKLTKEILPG